MSKRYLYLSSDERPYYKAILVNINASDYAEEIERKEDEEKVAIRKANETAKEKTVEAEAAKKEAEKKRRNLTRRRKKPKKKRRKRR